MPGPVSVPSLRLAIRSAAGALLIAAAPLSAIAQQVDARLFQEMRWRMIGPFRGGRTVAATGVPGRPGLFYIGVNNGGVWKSTDFGHVWTPIFDDQPTGSIGALALAPSNPSIIYVGTGEGLQRPDLSTGDGIYKSIDGGKSWTHLGLHDGQQIAQIIVDPRDPDRLFVAVLGHPYGPNDERGVYRSTDGGASFQRVLYRDENTGAFELAFDPANPQTVYADLWAGRQAPWEVGGSWNAPGAGLWKSTDGGTTWRQLAAGLPTADQGLGRIGFCVAPSDPNRLYATVDAPQLGGLYRSDDAGESWKRVSTEPRLWGRGSDFAELKVDPKNANIIYDANVATYRSTDGGFTWTAIKGAPGGDDYHRLWISPDDSRIILIASDQGATMTVNGGETWSSWYNQPTAQFYHVITDDQFPYWVYGGQQESGSVGIRSRGDDGAITFRDWRPVGVEEYGYVAPDPRNPDIIYGGKATRYDRTTGDVQNIAPEVLRSGKYRFVRTMPILFSPVDPRILYLASNVLFVTTSGGQSWDVISPDLTRERYDLPKNVGTFATLDPEKGKHRGVIYAVAPSRFTTGTIWAGTDDGLIHLTRDGGKSWTNITPPQLVPWAKVSQLDASHFDDNTVYAAVNTFRLDDLRPHIWRTHDGGRTWTEIVAGLPDGAIVNTVREDPERRGLLFAGTERAVSVSFDDGDHWQSLRLNMPATSIRDLVIHHDDIVVGTHGRSFWILDDITPLRQIDASVARSEAVLFRPQVAVRVMRSRNTDTPLPPEEPAGQNPPDGAILDYWLASPSQGVVTLEIADDRGRVVRRYASDDQPLPVNARELQIPTYWIRPPRTLSAQAGMHRFVWDLHEAPPDALSHEYPISAIVHDTPREPLGPVVAPGEYVVKLTVGSAVYTQPLTVKMDPRVRTPAAALARTYALARAMADGMSREYGALQRVRVLRAGLKALGERTPAPSGALGDSIAALDARAAALETGAGAPPGSRNLTGLNGELAGVLDVLAGSDAVPTTQAVAAADLLTRATAELLARWESMRSVDVAALNAQLRQAGQPPIAP